jgi:hypothetical protein
LIGFCGISRSFRRSIPPTPCVVATHEDEPARTRRVTEILIIWIAACRLSALLLNIGDGLDPVRGNSTVCAGDEISSTGRVACYPGFGSGKKEVYV